MKKRAFVTGIYNFLIILIDIFIIIFSIYMAFVIKFGFDIPRFNFEPFIITAPAIAAGYLVFMHIFKLENMIKHSIGELTYSVLLIVLSLMVFTMAINFFLRTFSFPRTVMVVSSALQFSLLSFWRLIVWKVKRKIHGKKVTMVIGNYNAEIVSKKILLKQREIYNIKFIYSTNSSNLWSDLHKVEVVFICDDVEEHIRSMILDICISERKSVYIVPKIYDIALLDCKLNRVDDIPVLKVTKLGLTIEQKVIKRLVDIILSAIGIIIASVPMMLITLIVRKDGGPAFYKQERLTEDNKCFKMIKFRTMVPNAENLTGPVLATEEDPRITAIGNFLRKTRLDELPQLFNIFMGTMSIVGPRPERPFFANQFIEEIPEYKYRTAVKAGLTGLAQVLGKYNTSAKDKARYDVIYIKNYSLLLDFKLMLQTLRIIFIKESTEGIKDEISLDRLINKLEVELTMDKE